MGEEVGPWQKNPRTPPQQTHQRLAMANYFHEHDPYHHHIVIHNGMPFDDILGPGSDYTGVSLQCSWSAAHRQVLRWVVKSDAAGKPWAVANDEQNPASMGVPADPGYQGHSGEGIQKGQSYTLHDVRKHTLWGTLMAGGWGVEYYFGYQLPENDLRCQDYRSRHRSWGYGRVAREFFHDHHIPFWEMRSADALVGNPENDDQRYCLAKRGEVYVIYLPDGSSAELDLAGTSGSFAVRWFNPRTGRRIAGGCRQRHQRWSACVSGAASVGGWAGLGGARASLDWRDLPGVFSTTASDELLTHPRDFLRVFRLRTAALCVATPPGCAGAVLERVSGHGHSCPPDGESNAPGGHECPRPGAVKTRPYEVGPGIWKTFSLQGLVPAGRH